VEHVVAVPAVLGVDELEISGHVLGSGEDGWSVAAGECVVADDQHWQFGVLELIADCVAAGCDLAEDGSAVAEVVVLVGEVSRRADAEHLRPLLLGGLQDAGVEHGSFGSGVDSDQQDEVCVLDGLDLRVEEVVRAEVAAEGEVVPAPELVVEAVEGVEEVLEGLDVLHALELADARRYLLPLHLVDARRHHRQHVLPALFCEVSALPQQGHSQSLPLESVVGLPRLVGQPLLIERFVHSGVHAHNGVILVVNCHVAAQRVHEVDGILGQQFVGAGSVGEGAVVQRTDRADVGQVAAELGGQHLLDVGVDLSGPAPAGRSQVVIPSDLLGEPDASGAVDAPVHVGDHQRADVLVLDSPFVLVVPACGVPVEVGVVLQVALAALVADGAVERVVGEQELHDCAPRESGGLGVGPDLHGGGDLGAAGGHWLGRLLDVDQAHPAVACHFESFVIAEAGNFNAVLLGRLEDGEVVIDLVGFVIDKDLDLFGGEEAERVVEIAQLSQHHYLYEL
jgi:hypothetical protein